MSSSLCSEKLGQPALLRLHFPVHEKVEREREMRERDREKETERDTNRDRDI